MYPSFLLPDSFFYEYQMMVNILFHNTDRLGNISYRQRVFFKPTYDFLPDSLFSFIAHAECSFLKVFRFDIYDNTSFQIHITGIIILDLKNISISYRKKG